MAHVNAKPGVVHVVTVQLFSARLVNNAVEVCSTGVFDDACRTVVATLSEFGQVRFEGSGTDRSPGVWHDDAATYVVVAHLSTPDPSTLTAISALLEQRLPNATLGPLHLWETTTVHVLSP